MPFCVAAFEATVIATGETHQPVTCWTNRTGEFVTMDDYRRVEVLTEEEVGSVVLERGEQEVRSWTFYIQFDIKPADSQGFVLMEQQLQVDGNDVSLPAVTFDRTGGWYYDIYFRY